MFQYDKDAQNIVTLTLDMAERSMNVLNPDFMAAFEAVLDRLATEAPLAGVVITSAKETFLVGADLDWLSQITEPGEVFAAVERLKVAWRRLETLGCPVVAALNGSTLGGGLELALACHHRVALADSRLKLGFPEVNLGLIPGGGGITRLTRMLGLQDAFPILSDGKLLNPEGAQAAGLIDALASDPDDLLAQAKAWIVAHPEATQPWDRPGYRLPGGTINSPKVSQMLAIAPAMLKQRTRGNYPAPEAIMTAAVEGVQVDFEIATRIESRYMAQVATGSVARNMVQALWYQRNQIKRGASRPAEIGPQETARVGVLGAGLMGHGIAYVTAWAGMPVVLKDVTLEKAEAGKAKIAVLLERRVSRGRMTAVEQGAILDRIQPTAEASDLAGCDLVIEAVFEDRALKEQVTQEAEAHLSHEAIFASNTSSLPITSLAAQSNRPENFIGLHFFSPVHRMQLVEIVCGTQTAPRTLAKAFDYVLKIRKTPIVVNDSRGFYTTRVFETYIMEGMALLAEGQHPRAIESAGMQGGMPLGPLAVTDEISLELARHIREQARRDLAAAGQTLPPHPADAVLDFMTGEAQRLGRAHGAGFYDYPAEAEKYLWPALQSHFWRAEAALPQTALIERLMFIQTLETVRCCQEGVLNSVADANLGSIYGWGFAPFKGGTLQYINDYGLPAFVDRAEALAQRYGDRFAPPMLLQEMAVAGQAFE